MTVWVVSTLWLCVPALLLAQVEKSNLVTHEILHAATENGTFTSVATEGYRLTGGLHMPSVPADGESLIWGVIELKDADGKPVPNAVVEINTTAGVIHWVEEHPTTDAEGVFIFALQSTRQPTSFRVRFNFPQFGVGGTLSGSFCRVGEPGCFLPRTCASINATSEYYPIENDPDSLTCATTLADQFRFYAVDTPEPPVLYFDYVTFKNNRPAGAFPERRLYLSYTECQNVFGNDLFCLCLQGYKEGVLDYTYGWGDTFSGEDRGLPNGENIAEVTYLQYQAGVPGRVCKKEFRFQASSPLVRLRNEWVIVTDENPSPSVEVEIVSPHWQGDMTLVIEYGPERRLHHVRTPGHYTIPLERTLLGGAELNTPYQVRATLKANTGYASNFTASDTTESFVRMDSLNLWALGYNPQSRTFDFAISYRLTCTHPHFTRTPLVAQGHIAVYYGNDLNHQIHAENLSNSHFTAGQHTAVVRIPENQMTRFGTYRFVPHFTDNFARYYRDERPRQVRVDSGISFTTPTITEVKTAYSVRGIPTLTSQTREQLMYPYAGDKVDVIALISASCPNETLQRYAYGPVPRTSVYIDEATWNGSQQSEWLGEVYPDTDFFQRPTLTLARIERNDQASASEAGHRLWPGPKLEFRWVEITHQTGTTSNRRYWYTLQEVPSISPIYSLQAERGTRRYAVAVTNPHWDYYLVGGIDRISKDQWSQYVSGNRRINNSTARAAMRISVRERIAGSDTNYRLRILEWATAFLKVRYDLGGCWFGGRVHPTDKDADTGYQGFGNDCSKLVTAAARMEGITWPRDWWNINTGFLLNSRYTDNFSSPREGRIQVDRGDILVRPEKKKRVRDPRTGRIEEKVEQYGHVMFVYSVNKTSIRDTDGQILDCRIDEIQLLESTGSPENRVRIHARNVGEGATQCALRELQNDQKRYQVRRIPDRRR
ncbi:MAG: Ig-like domain-containing protein [Fimbriimonadales bacterium]|nr:Ig-like domain-containing protein [Fimbriimonadales bacterium]